MTQAGSQFAQSALAHRWWWKVLLVTVWRWWILAFWPGQLEVDALNQIVQGRTSVYTDSVDSISYSRGRAGAVIARTQPYHASNARCKNLTKRGS